MGRIARPRGEGVTKHYWYPGQKADWIQAAVALGGGLVVLAAVALTTHSGLWAAVLGGSVTTGISGLHVGRRDASGLRNFPDASKSRKVALANTARAMWRAAIKGVAAAGAAVLVVNMSAHGIMADWVLPMVPAVVGAVVHQAGMLWERLAQEGTSPPVSAAKPTKVAA